MKLAKWFASDDRILSELFDLGTLKILKRPVSEYPKSLQDMAQKSPILARSDEIQARSGIVGAPFKPTPVQTRFHERLEACLRERPSVHREGGSKNNIDVLETFRLELRRVLVDASYRRWIKSAFSGITDRGADEFIGFITEPSRAIDRIRSIGETPKYREGETGPIFDTNLAAQVAKTFRDSRGATSKEGTAFIRLVHSMFCTVFAFREEAKGLFGSTVRELVLMSDAPNLPDWSPSKAKLVTIQTVIRTPVHLPEPEPGFAKIIHSIRMSPEGKKLRKSMTTLGTETNFATQQLGWEAVSGLIASKTHKAPTFSFSTVVAEVLGKVTMAVMVEALAKKASLMLSGPGPLKLKLAKAFAELGVVLRDVGLLHAGVDSLYLAGTYLNELQQCFSDRARMQSALIAAAPQNRCVEVRVPPISIASLQ